MSEPLRIGSQSGYQTMAEAKDVRSGADVMVVQWLRFGGGGYLQMVGIARADGWTDVLSRLRSRARQRRTEVERIPDAVRRDSDARLAADRRQAQSLKRSRFSQRITFVLRCARNTRPDF